METLSPESIVGYDSETYLIARGRLAPRLVCGSFATIDDKWIEAPAPLVIERLEALLDDPRVGKIVGHNLAFDTTVAPAFAPRILRKIFEAYRDGRFADTKTRQQLLDIRNGCFRFRYEDDGSVTAVRYGLDDLCERYGLPRLNKGGDSYRLRYNELEGVAAKDYPEEARIYAEEDAWSTREVYFKQTEGRAEDVTNEQEQVRAAFALQLTSVWGMRTDSEKVRTLKAKLEIEAHEMMEKLKATGIFRDDGTKDTKVLKRLVEEAFEKQGLPVPKTEKGATKTDADTLNLSGDNMLAVLADGGALKLLNTFVPVLEAATEIPIQPGYEPLVASGRCSSRNPVKRKKGEIPVGCNIQQLPRADGIRPCFVPRKGWVFSSNDYSVAELRELAQIHYWLFGRSSLRDAFLKGIDPHLVLAATMMGKDVEWVVENRKTKEVKDSRQFAKIPNFGLPGGLGAASLVDFARTSYNTIIDLTTAKEWIKLWHATWPEMRPYLDWIASKLGPSGEGAFEQFYSKRIRAACGYTDGANCVDYETEALTQRGWLKGSEITLEDYILTKNSETNELEWQQPTAINQFPDYEGPLVEFNSRSFSAVTTPNHRWLVTKNKTEKNACVTSGTISVHGDDRIHRTGIWNKKDNETISDDFLSLLGWIVTDGSFETEGTRIRIYQTKTHNVSKIDSLFYRLNINVKRRTREFNNVVWGFTGDLAAAFRKIAPDRIISFDFISTLSKRQARLLLETMIDGDGNHADKGQIHFYVRDEKRVAVFQFLCIIAGFSTAARWRDMSNYSYKSEKMPNVPKMNGCWIISVLRRDKVQIVKKQVRRFEEKKGVWCPSVPNTYFVARRRGTTYITGNTLFQGGVADFAKEALWRVAWECYLGDDGWRKGSTPSPLFGSRPVAFIHDEILAEHPLDPDGGTVLASKAAHRIAEIMIFTAQEQTPDVPAVVEPALCMCWEKGMEAVYAEKNGEKYLIPWTPPPPKQEGVEHK